MVINTNKHAYNGCATVSIIRIGPLVYANICLIIYLPQLKMKGTPRPISLKGAYLSSKSIDILKYTINNPI